MDVVEQGRGAILRLAIALATLLVMGGVAGAAEIEGQGGEESAAPEAAAAKPVRISMDFKDADLKNVLKSFSQQTGINVIASDEVATRTITLFLEDVTVMDALDRILEAGNLTYERPAGSQIYVVKPKPKAAPEPVPTITKVYRLKFARVSTSRLAKASEGLASSPTNIVTLPSTGTSSTSGGSTSTSTSQTTGTTAGSEIGVDKVVKQLLTENGAVSVDERTNSLVVTDVPSNFLRIESVLKALDIRTAQVLIEAEVLETTLAKAKDLGVKWGSGTSGTLFQLTPAMHKTNFPFGDWFGRHGWRSVSDADTGLTSSQLGTVDASQAVAILQALERDTDTKILARPKILTLDNERAIIQLSTQEAVGFTSTVTGSSGASTTAAPERMTTGTILVVTPQVNEHGYITMMVEPSVTKASVSTTITPPSTAGSAVKDPKTRSVRALVRMRQGETLVMGGLIDHTEEDVHSKVPVLGDVPIFGAAFRHNGVSRSASELVIFVTPRILEEPSETQLASSGTAAPFSPREQEPAAGRQEEMEKRLNALEREKHL